MLDMQKLKTRTEIDAGLLSRKRNPWTDLMVISGDQSQFVQNLITNSDLIANARFTGQPRLRLVCTSHSI